MLRNYKGMVTNMTPQEQIKEMARIICESRLENDCKRCAVYGRCLMERDAERLYKAGYRKVGNK